MPHTNKASAPVSVDIPEFEGRYVDLDGHTIGFEIYKADVDPAEFFRGLPDDRCQCPHWGVVLTGSISERPGRGSVGRRKETRVQRGGNLLLKKGSESGGRPGIDPARRRVAHH